MTVVSFKLTVIIFVDYYLELLVDVVRISLGDTDYNCARLFPEATGSLHLVLSGLAGALLPPVSGANTQDLALEAVADKPDSGSLIETVALEQFMARNKTQPTV